MSLLLRVSLTFLVLLAPAFVRPACADLDNWYELEIAGRACGFVHEVELQADDLVRTTHEEQFVVARDGRRVEVFQQTVFEETPRGEPLRARVELRAGGEPSVTLYEFTDDGFDRITEQRGGMKREHVKLDPGNWLTPAEVGQFVRARLEAGAKRIAYETLEASDGMRLIQVRSELQGVEEHMFQGRRLKLSRWQTRTSGSPITLEEYRSEDGVVVMARSDLGIGEMKLRLVDEATARKALGSPAPELLTSTVVPVRGMPPRSERIRHAKYIVRADGVEEFTMPDSGAQRVREHEKGGIEVELEVGRGSRASESEQEDPAYLGSSVLVDPEDPEIRAFARRAVRGRTAEPGGRAELLRVAVGRHMTRKNFGTAFASASDAVRERSGDCTEHAVLLVAALRANGIPARVATGLVHADLGRGARDREGGGFAWHMWAQALIDGEWIDLDPTRPLGFDAGHLLVSTTSLQDGGGQAELAQMLPLLGRLQIDVVQVDHRDVKQGVR